MVLFGPNQVSQKVYGRRDAKYDESYASDALGAVTIAMDRPALSPMPGPFAPAAFGIVRTAQAKAELGVGNAHPEAPYMPSRPLLTMIFTATRRFCALPPAVSLGAAGSASDIPVGVSIRYGFQWHACCR